MDKGKGAGVYAIFDKVAVMLVGGLYLQKHDAAAIRFFHDVASAEQSLIRRHPGDFQLIRLGAVDEEGNVLAEREVILEGSSWAAVQQQGDASASS